MSTTTEWVVRKFIPDKENNPCIYKGMPLHTEYRVFVDFDKKSVIGIHPYWESDTMKKRFAENRDGHDIHDYVVYQAHEDILMDRYNYNKDKIIAETQKLIQYVQGLAGQWSIDIMQNNDKFWLIDMALAKDSAFYDCVPENLKNPTIENWIPEQSVIQQIMNK